MLEWLVIGGGIHGTYLSRVLARGGGMSRVRVLDPHEEPLARWDACTDNVGMRFLRSSFVHHLGDDPYELKRFAEKRTDIEKKPFLGRYLRPSLRLFRAHTEQMIQRENLMALRLRGAALALFPQRGGMRVETSQGSLETKRVLLALGASDQPHFPDFAQELRARGAPVHHVFEPGFSRKNLKTFRHVVVVGGGISAAQTALALAERQEGAVTLLSRSAPRVFAFDTSPGWMGPKHLDGFATIANFDERRRVLRAARHPGSMPDDVVGLLRDAIKKGSIKHRIASVESGEFVDGEVRLALRDGSAPVVSDLVVLATGFEARRPGGAWLDNAVHEMGLRCAACGYPIVDSSLRWHQGIYVTGQLAELQLGPPARNILGARLAAERLMKVAS